jgi:hypothetical protein
MDSGNCAAFQTFSCLGTPIHLKKIPKTSFGSQCTRGRTEPHMQADFGPLAMRFSAYIRAYITTGYADGKRQKMCILRIVANLEFFSLDVTSDSMSIAISETKTLSTNSLPFFIQEQRIPWTCIATVILGIRGTRYLLTRGISHGPLRHATLALQRPC